MMFKQFDFFAGDIHRPQCIPELSVFKSPSICLPVHTVRAENAVQESYSTLVLVAHGT
ncbi:hypothetical protein PRBEI_2000333400 [Prionailurus iriomotensis]